MMDLATCDHYEAKPYFQSWAYGTGGARYHQGPGQIDLVRLVDVGGELLVVDASYWPATPSAAVADLHAVLDSMTLELPANQAG